MFWIPVLSLCHLSIPKHHPCHTHTHTHTSPMRLMSFVKTEPQSGEQFWTCWNGPDRVSRENVDTSIINVKDFYLYRYPYSVGTLKALIFNQEEKIAMWTTELITFVRSFILRWTKQFVNKKEINKTWKSFLKRFSCFFLFLSYLQLLCSS